MEPNNASSSAAAAATSPETADDQALSSVDDHAKSLLPPPSPSLISPSPVIREGDDASLSIQALAASPSSPPPSAHLPAPLASSKPSSSASRGLPAFLSGAIPGFAAKLVLLEKLAAWQRENPLVSPASGVGSRSGPSSGLPPPSSDSGGLLGKQPKSPDYELPPLPESLRIPELENESTHKHNMSSTTGVIMPSNNCSGSSSSSSAAAAMGIDNSCSSSSMPEPLSVGAKKKASRFLHLAPGADGNGTRVNFNKYEKEIISKDRSLQELVATDPEKVRRLIAYRVYSAKRNAGKEKRTLELQRQLETLQTMRDTKSAELQLPQAQRDELQAEQTEMSMIVHELQRQVMLKDALSETLQAQINALNLIILNAVQTCSKKIDETNGLHQQSNTQITNASASHTNAPHQHKNPDMVQLQQLQTQEQQSEHPQVHALEPQQKDDQVMDQQQHQDF
ncbi:unnamed protein product [Urochloa humidicola]